MPSQSSSSRSGRDVVPLGSRQVFKHSKDGRKLGPIPESTQRALVLRNAKYGAGAGDLILTKKPSGREKLELLAEDLIEKSKKAIGAHLSLEKCMKIALSQLSANLDEIENLHDHDLFYYKIKTELEILLRSSPGVNLRDSKWIASVIAARIHNAYMLTSAWRLVRDTLEELHNGGLPTGSVTVQNKLKNDPALRSRYLVLYDIVNVLVQAGQTKFALLVTTTEHYSRFFRKQEDSEAGYAFAWSEVRAVHKSFLDSIIVELCLPQSSIPPRVLMDILHLAVTEAPQETRRFPQAVWDAMGDLSFIVELQEMLEAPLLGPDGDKWRKEPRQMPEDFEHWVDAQIYSEKASKRVDNWTSDIFPIERTQHAQRLEKMWQTINLNYEADTGRNIDDLWQVADLRNLAPQWHSYSLTRYGDGDLDSDSEATPRRRPPKARKPLALTNGHDHDDGFSSLPDLQEVSNSSDECSDDEDKSDEGDEEFSEHEASEYDTDEEDLMRDWAREAMDAVAAVGDLDDDDAQAEFDALTEERKGNPFLKLLGSLRGRMFQSSPTLRTTDRTQPRHPMRPGKAAPPSSGPSTTSAPGSRTAGAPKSFKTTVEDVEDEEEAAAAKKKKKKPKKKKKKPAAVATETGPEGQDVPQSPAASATPTAPSATADAAPQEGNNSAQPDAQGQDSGHARGSVTSKKKKKSGTKAAPSASRVFVDSGSSSATAVPSFASSSTHIPLQRVQTAQSAHSYLKTEGVGEKKAKVKSRPDFANLKESNLFSRFSRNDKHKGEADEGGKTDKPNVFSRLSKKTAQYMHQLMQTSADEKQGKASMRWDNFVKVMEGMGFKYDPSTAGSSVRFDPPDSRDVPITFHKRKRSHPDPTIHPVMLKEFRKKLKRYYGWDEKEWDKAMGD
ncbi:hypothetical protein CERSUDRAFT_114203 [Gelatoporia subvermispora B]|uniref:Uncharacterized protein n=1 Tax=Ceriporiopsis subvermispora (strain B) TaxID=914234 RepID=M2PMF6_CERS8|nr:hypothetical protein CERSUDRAFT_114203 [Gelatoporia subvermispora B]